MKVQSEINNDVRPNGNATIGAQLLSKIKGSKAAKTSAAPTESPVEVAKGEIVPAVAKVDIPQQLTLSAALASFSSAELSPEEQKEAKVVTAFVFDKLHAAQQNLLEIGTRLNTLKSEWGYKKFNMYVDRVLVKTGLFSLSNVGLWQGRARVLEEKIPHQLVRKQLLTIGDGKSMVVRIEPSAEAKKAGEKAHYDLSPYLAKAMEVIPAPKGKLNEEHAEQYARSVIALKNKLQSDARVSNPAKERQDLHDRAKSNFGAFLDKYGMAAATSLFYELFQLTLAKAENVKPALDLVGSLDKMVETAAAVKGIDLGMERTN